jgi:predicted O-linked N-acetylglucosamine transferase (SPINDLY family)
MAEQDSQQVPISEAMRLAIDHHQAGRLPEAEAIYRAILESDPRHAGATYNLALIALQQGRPREAVPVMRDATQREPRNASHWMNYAAALAGSGQPQAARDVLLKARQRQLGGKAIDGLLEQVERMIRSAASPTVVETVGEAGGPPLRSPNLQALLRLYEQGQHAQVEAQAREFWPQFAHSATLARLLGGVLLAQGKYEEAREVLMLAKGTHGGDALIHRMLGMALRRLGRHEEARTAFERSLELAPDDVETLLHAAVNALNMRDPEHARRHAERALALQPGSVGALWVLADATASLGGRAEAVDLYRRAIAVDPNIADLYINLGDALTKLARPNDAVPELEHALKLRPNDAQAHLNLGNALYRLGETRAAREHYRTASDLAPDRVEAHTAYLFCLLHDDTVTPEQSFREHLRVGELIEAPRRKFWRPHENDRDPERGLRVGFVSGDLRNHAVAYLIEPIWQAMRGGRHQVIAYANMQSEDEVSARLRQLTDAWVRVERLDDAAFAERIRQDRIDILFDLSGHTTDNRLSVFAMKPAPVQVTMIGYPGTTGLSAMDYRAMRRPREAGDDIERFYCEKLVRLQFRGFQPEWDAPEVVPLPALTAGRMTFCSFNRPGKISEPTVDLWARVMRAVPGSRMLIGAAGEERTQERLRAQFEARGIGADRLTFRPKVPLAEYLAMHNEVDVMLDTFPYTGGTTTHHALWMGVPVLTLAGDTPQQRQTATILGAAGMDEWVTRSPEAFVEQARRATSDLEALNRLRQGLRPSMAARFHGTKADLAREMDTALQTMWRRWCAGLPPESFTVSS